MVVGVLCGGFDTDDVLLDDFFCVGARILYELHCVHCVAGLASKDMTAGDQRFVLSLQCGSDGHFGWLVHLLVLGWCTFVHLVGVLLVDWVWPVRQPVSEPGGCEDRPRRSTNKRHALGVLLKGIEDLFVDSGSDRELHVGFFFIAGDGED